MIENDQNILVVIPARMGSTRLPGKVMLSLDGKPILQHVYERVKLAGYPMIVATPDQVIFDFVTGQLEGRAVMTSLDHQNGTSRCIEACELIEQRDGISVDFLINIQGDEPMIDASLIQSLVEKLIGNHHRTCDVATVAYRVPSGDTLTGNSEVYIVKNKWDEALYFSRSVIPFLRDVAQSDWTRHHTYLRHVGVYAFDRSFLKEISSEEKGTLEEIEKLEQLRWLEKGHKIAIVETDINMQSIDTEQDLSYVQSIWNQ